MNKNQALLLEKIKNSYHEQDNCMGDFLAFVTMEEFGMTDIISGMTMEDFFEVYVEAKKWADGDRFYIAREDGEPEEI